jgi:type II secretion system protein N
MNQPVESQVAPIIGKRATIALTTAIFLFSFVFFLYLTFPYVVLKESVGSQVSQMTGYSIYIGDLGPAFPIGLAAKDVSVLAPGASSPLKIKEAEVNVGILSLLMGKLSSGLILTSKDKGELEVDVDFGLLRLIKGEAVPSRFSLHSQNYPIDDSVSFALSAWASSPSTNQLLGPLLTTLGISGRLNGEINMKLNAAEPAQSSGNVDIRIDQAMLKLADPALGLPDQKFSKALVKASLAGGNFLVDEASGFVTEELQVNLRGNVTLSRNLQQSQMKMDIGLKLDKEMKESFGWLVDAAAGGSPRNGEVTIQMTGPVSRPDVKPL